MSEPNESQNPLNFDLRTRIAAVLSDALVADNSILTVQYGSGSTSNIVVNCNALADAVIRELTDAIPPIVATAIRGYAQSGLVALSHHGDDSAIEELKRLNEEAIHIAQYATTHEDWNG